MDWQHLIMNGESLGEYAALLAAEGLLGHQHANSGWGTFDDDNMVGATAFMETLELAVELRRARYGENGERLGFDLYPYTEDAVAAVAPERDAVALHRRSSRRGSTTPRCARRSRARTPSAPTSSSTRRSARSDPGRNPDAPRAAPWALNPPWSASTSARPASRRSRSPRRRGAWPSRRAATRSRRRGPAGRSRIPRTGGAPPRRRSPRCRPGGEVAGIGLSGQMHGLVVLDDADRGHPPGDPLERPAHGGRVRRDRGARRARAADRADGQPRADGLHRAEAALAAPARAGGVRAHRPRSCCRRTTSGSGSPASGRSTPPTRRGRCCSTSRGALERRGAASARAPARVAAARARVARPRGCGGA